MAEKTSSRVIIAIVKVLCPAKTASASMQSDQIWLFLQLDSDLFYFKLERFRVELIFLLEIFAFKIDYP